MLSGISTSFPVLSLSMRQVAHALLTRPPLIRTRRYFTVRLECVMHAARVHPEPGSNSLKNCISFKVSLECYQLIRVILYAQLLKRAAYLSKLFKFKRIFGVFFSTFVVVQFSMSDSLSSLVDSLYIISHQVPFVKWFFKSFLNLFSNLGSFCVSLSPLVDSPVIISYQPSLVNPFSIHFPCLELVCICHNTIPILLCKTTTRDQKSRSFRRNHGHL